MIEVILETVHIHKSETRTNTVLTPQGHLRQHMQTGVSAASKPKALILFICFISMSPTETRKKVKIERSSLALGQVPILLGVWMWRGLMLNHVKAPSVLN